MKITIKHYLKDFQVLCIEASYIGGIKPIGQSLKDCTVVRVLDNPKTECEKYIQVNLAPELLSILNSENPLDNKRFTFCVVGILGLMESDAVLGIHPAGEEVKKQIKELFIQLEDLNLPINISTGYFRHTREVYAFAKTWQVNGK